MEFDPVLVHEWLRRSARRVPRKEAIICGQERWSYRKLDAYSDRFAEALLDLGICRQDRVVILTGNGPETVVSLYGTLKAGGVFIICEGNTKARRLSYILRNSAAKVLVAWIDQAAVVQEALAESNTDLKIVWVGADAMSQACPRIPSITWESVFAPFSGGDGGTYAAADRLPRCLDIDLACLIYTSGTTGNPKGVMCSHRDVVSAAKSIIQYLENRPEDVILNALPLSFGYGLYQVLMSSLFGGTVILESSFLYPQLMLKRVAQEKVTGLPLVPSMAAMMLRIENIATYDFSTLRYLTSASAALPVPHLRSLRRLIPHATFYNMYGLTECVRVCFLAGEELDRRPASVGRPMPNCEVSVVDENGAEVEPGEIGELIIRGSNVMQGYWNDPETTARVYRPGPYPGWRWLHSGDYFRRDEEGLLHFVGRKDDMIKTRGERVSPKEVEDTICELEAVAEAAAIGVPDEILGQAIKVFVVTRAGGLDEKTVLKHCANRLSPFMVPKYVVFVPGIPKTAHGKISRRELQASEEK
jgi:amino acid adenylation domain-containing protein